LLKRPAALESFIFDYAVFHHLHQHADYAQREIAKYLSTPAPDDVLDDVINDRGCTVDRLTPPGRRRAQTVNSFD
jgi:hypothetical protein